MESLLLGQKNASVDAKGRFILPNDFKEIGCGTGIVFARFPNEYYKIYMLERIEDIIGELQSKKHLAGSIKDYNDIVTELNTVFNMIVDTGKLDKQRRIVLPSEVRDKMTNSTVMLQGKGDSITLFPNEEIYQKYCEENLSNIIRL